MLCCRWHLHNYFSFAITQLAVKLISCSYVFCFLRGSVSGNYWCVCVYIYRYLLCWWQICVWVVWTVSFNCWWCGELQWAATCGVCYSLTQILQVMVLLGTGGANGGGYVLSKYALIGLQAVILLSLGLLNCLPVQYFSYVSNFSMVWNALGKMSSPKTCRRWVLGWGCLIDPSENLFRDGLSTKKQFLHDWLWWTDKTLLLQAWFYWRYWFPWRPLKGKQQHTYSHHSTSLRAWVFQAVPISSSLASLWANTPLQASTLPPTW